MTLDNAQRGYEYQDVITALHAVDVMMGTVQTLLANRTNTTADRFDDLTARRATGTLDKYQIKHSVNPTELGRALFTNDRRRCRIDKLVASALADRASPSGPADIYRLVTTDIAPTDERLSTVLVPATAPDPGPFLVSVGTTRLRFDLEAMWPSGELAPTAPWTLLSGVSRNDADWFLNRFIVEVGAPAASFDLAQPGGLEALLLRRLEHEVGIGEYPLVSRRTVDIARSVIDAARRARLGTLDLARFQLLNTAGIQTDYGAVTRHQLSDPASEIFRTDEVSELLAAVEADGQRVVLLVGPPGQGKSWTMEQVQTSLDDKGWITAEHQCYLGEQDPDREERALGETVFGTLLARLADSAPEIIEAQRPRFSGTEITLTRALADVRNREPSQRIALFVDGLDHVTRIRGSGPLDPDPSRSLARRLADLALPDGVTLIVSSQPGEYLQPLEESGALVMPLPRWNDGDLLNLAEKLGVLGEESDAIARHDLAKALGERSDGNPLYATYLCRELLPLGVRNDPARSISQFPLFDGTLDSYYAYLLRAAPTTQWFARLLALIRFPVTRTEVGEIFPEFRSWIDEAIEGLSPVIAEKPSHGGLRIYHESFARHVTAGLLAAPDQLAPLIEHLRAWLSARGFLTDTRAYRHLIPILRMADRHSEVVALIEENFAARSVAAGFSADVIASNLASAVESASAIGDWPAVVRFIELTRAIREYEFNPLEETLIQFVDVPIALVGARVVAERLLEDGRVSFPSREGLMLCAAIDAIGEQAPWEQYIDAYERDELVSNTVYGADSDRRVAGALLRGHLRLLTNDLERDPDTKFDLSSDWLAHTSVEPDEIVNTVANTVGDSYVVALLEAAPSLRLGDYALAVANYMNQAGVQRLGDRAQDEWADQAARSGVSPGRLPVLAHLGVSMPSPPTLADLLASTTAMQRGRAALDSGETGAWLDLLERSAAAGPIDLEQLGDSIAGAGWYPCWIRFCI